MAIDRSGKLYGWGVAYAVGLGVVKAIVTPSLIPVAAMGDSAQARARRAAGVEPDADEDADVDYEFLEDQQADAALGAPGATYRSAASAEDRREVVDVACGGGFTVCVTKAGHVFTWGVWAHGRLGEAIRKICDVLL